MSFSANYPTIAPSLLLDFANSNAVDPRVTFTRASTATYFDSIGTLQSAAINTPRLDYNPTTLAAQGLLIEEQRVNSIRNNTMVGAVAGTPGTNPTNWTVATSATGLTKEIVGTGTENGITYIDIRFSGTSTSSGTLQISSETSTGVAALTGQTWTTSSYIKLAAGTLPGVVSWVWIERDAGGVPVTSPSFSLGTPTTNALNTQRYTNTRTLSGGASVAFVTVRIDVNIPNTTAIDITLRIGLPQLELGAFATSVIPTSTVAVTRSADVASVNTLTPWYNATEGTLYAEASPQILNTSSFNLAELNDATVNNRIGIYKLVTTGNASLAVIVSNTTQTSTNSGAWPATGKLAGAYKLDDFASSLNGSAAATDILGTIPTVTQLNLGRRGDGSNVLNGYIRRITYFPVRLSNANLQALTS